MGWFATLKKKLGPKYGVQKTGSLLSKREEAMLLLLFLNNNDPIFKKFQILKKYQFDLISYQGAD